MFKKYAKNLLEKEVMDTSSLNEATEELLHAAAFSSPIDTPPLSHSLLKHEEVAKDIADEWEEPEMIIGENVTMKGTLTFQRLIRIDGNFEGELVSSGKLIIGPKGSIKADINLNEAFISGKVEGDITVKERLALRGRAEVKGNITAPRLSVDEGVTIMGQLSVISEEVPS